MNKLSKISKEEGKRRINLYQKGFSIAEIAKKVHRSPGAIWASLKQRKIPRHHLQASPISFKLTKEEKGYIAGIIDGEGWMGKTIGKCHRLTITNTNKKLLEFLLKKIPCSKIYKMKKYKKMKDAWQWDIGKTYNVYQLLKLISHLLIVKKEKAQKVLGDLNQYFK